MRRAVALALLAALSASPVSARPLAEVEKTGMLRVAVYLDYKPFSYREDGKSKGVDVEIAQALAESLHARLDLFEVRADDNVGDDLRNGVWKGTVVGEAPGDVMLHVPYDQQVAESNPRVVLVAPYHVDGITLFVDPSKQETARDLTLFKTEKAAVAVGTLGDYILISAQDHAYQANVKHERTLESAARDFAKGDVSAFYGESSAGQSFARAGGRPYATVQPDQKLAADWTLGAAVRIDSQDLGEAVAQEMGRLAASGRLKQIFAAYGVDWRPPPAAR